MKFQVQFIVDRLIRGAAILGEFRMAHWKRLTGTHGDQVDVNIDAVAYLHGLKDHTVICFIGGRSGEGKALVVDVREKPDTIHLATPLHSS
jgi:hypothetical protein